MQFANRYRGLVMQETDTYTYDFLLHLVQPSAAVMDEEASNQRLLSCSLALTILSTAARMPDLAASSDMIDLLPAVLRVARCGGIQGAIEELNPSTTSRPSNVPAATSDSTPVNQGVSESLEVATAVAASGVPALQAALEAGALEACTALMTDPLQRECWMAAARLMGTMAEGAAAAGRRSLLWEDFAQATAAAIAVLGSAMAAAAATAVGPPAKAAAQPPAAAPALDPAMLQLEAVHTLLLLLPPPEASTLHSQLLESAVREGQQDTGAAPGPSGTPSTSTKESTPGRLPWTISVRDVLNTMLRSKLGVRQKQSALQLAAALVQMFGHPWIMAGVQLPQGREYPAAPRTDKLLQARIRIPYFWDGYILSVFIACMKACMCMALFVHAQTSCLREGMLFQTSSSNT